MQLKVACRYLLPGLISETPIKSIFLLDQGYVFWLFLEWGIHSAYWLLGNRFSNNCHPIVTCQCVHTGGLCASIIPCLVTFRFEQPYWFYWASFVGKSISIKGSPVKSFLDVMDFLFPCVHWWDYILFFMASHNVKVSFVVMSVE